MLDPKQEHPFLFHESNNNNHIIISRPINHNQTSWDSINSTFRAQNPSPPASPVRNHYRSMSPSSRAQAIARGQRELMEMVSNMPESCYELSLKDLVEHNRQRNDDEERQNDMSSETDLLGRRSEEFTGQRSKGVGLVRRGVETNGSGHLLKMGFPMSFGNNKRKKKKKKTTIKRTNDEIGNSVESSWRVDKEWWKKRYSVTDGGDLSTDGSRKSTETTTTTNTSSSSSGSGSRSSSLGSQNSTNTPTNQRRGNGGCWWFIGKKKSREEVE